jgi:hypothetical protein
MVRVGIVFMCVCDRLVGVLVLVPPSGGHRFGVFMLVVLVMGMPMVVRNGGGGRDDDGVAH